MEVVYETCCGIDVHAEFLVACLIRQGKKETRRYATLTDELMQLRTWLVEAGCTHVAIESTGVYWKPVFNLLEGAVEVVLINPEHARVLRGRKTDVKDAAWLADLLRHGLVRASFIPPPEIRELREVTRYRESLVRERTSVANRIQKVIEGGNIKLGQVATDVLGASGRAMLRRLAQGETDAEKLAGLARGKLAAKQAELTRALTGRLTAAQRFVLGELLDRIDELDAAIARADREIDRQMTEHPKLADARARLDTIPGIGRRVADSVIAEIGVALRAAFPSSAHLASWAGLCPGQRESAGKRKSGRTRHGNTYLRAVLVQAAWAAVKRKHSFLNARYGRLAKRLGRKKALVAVAHSLLVIIYQVLDGETVYTDLGGDYFDRRRVEHQRDYHLRRLAALGFDVTVVHAAA